MYGLDEKKKMVHHIKIRSRRQKFHIVCPLRRIERGGDLRSLQGVISRHITLCRHLPKFHDN